MSAPTLRGVGRERALASGNESDRVEELIGRGRLVEHRVRASYCGGRQKARSGKGGVHDYARRPRERLQLAAERQTVAVWQLVVGQHHRGLGPTCSVDSGFGGSGGGEAGESRLGSQ
jgi:hypothetical protein